MNLFVNAMIHTLDQDVQNVLIITLGIQKYPMVNVYPVTAIIIGGMSMSQLK